MKTSWKIFKAISESFFFIFFQLFLFFETLTFFLINFQTTDSEVARLHSPRTDETTVDKNEKK